MCARSFFQKDHLAMQFRSVLMISTAPLLLAACNSGTGSDTADETVETPEVVLTTSATPTAAPDGTALVPGAWTVGEDASGVLASYSEEGMQPSLRMSCARGSTQMIVTLASSVASTEAWRLDAGGEAARIDFSPVGGGVQEIAAQVDQGLAIIHAMGAEGQAFMLTAPDGTPYQFPTHPGIRRVIQACTEASITASQAPPR